MKALILYYTYDSAGTLSTTKTAEFSGTISELKKACAGSKSGSCITVVHQVIILDQDNFRDPIEKKKSDFDDIYGL